MEGKKADTLSSKSNCDPSSLFQIFWLPKGKLYTLWPLKHFVKNCAKPVEAPPLVTSYCHRQADFFHRCAIWKSKFWAVVWFHFSYSVILYAQKAAVSCGIWQRSWSDGLVIWKREAASVPYSHCCHYQPSGEYYLWSFLYLLQSKSAVSLRYSAPKCLLVQARKILIEYSSFDGSRVFVLFAVILSLLKVECQRGMPHMSCLC